MQCLSNSQIKWHELLSIIRKNLSSWVFSDGIFSAVWGEWENKYWHVSATGDRHWTFLMTPDHAIYVTLLIATNNDLQRSRSLIHCRHFCIHWSQAESFHELLFENSFFLLFDLNPSWNYTFHFSSFLEFFYCTCHFFLHFFKYLFIYFFW